MSKTKRLPPGVRQRERKAAEGQKPVSVWVVDTSHKGKRINGTFLTPEMAETFIKKQQVVIEEGRYLDKKKVCKTPLGEFADLYLQWCKDVGQRAAGAKNSHIESIKSHFGKDRPLGSITRADIEKYQAVLLTTRSNRKGRLAPASVNKRMSCLSHLFRKAKEQGKIENNPCDGVGKLREDNRRLRYLTVEECNKLLAGCPSTLRQIVELALHTGMRKGEILQLKWEHVNLRQGYLEILEQKNGKYGTVPLGQRSVEILASIPRRLDSPYVFTGKIPGHPFWDLKRRFEEAVKRASLEGVTFHTLRHTAASHMVMNGIDLVTVKEILRHGSTQMTERYAHLAPGHKQAAVNVLGKALMGDPEKAAIAG